MTDAIRLNDPLIADMLQDPRLSERLIDCMHIQPELDPEAGYGVMMPFYMYRGMELSGAGQSALLRKADNPYRLYVILRAIGLLYMSPQALDLLLLEDEPLNYEAMLAHIASVCKSFRVDLAAPHM